MKQIHVPMHPWLKLAACTATCIALTGAAWAGYRAGDSQAAWAVLWSLCASAR